MSAVSAFEHLPDSRQSLLGITPEGDEAWLIRGISRKLYKCPGCYGGIGIGDDHVVVQYVLREGGTEHYHYHRRCAQEILVPELRSVKPVNAGESGRRKLEGRGKRPAGKRGRRAPRR
jgi:hypothetical protein